MGEKEINEFLSYLAVQKNVTASTQNQALCALIFLYRQILNKDVGGLEKLVLGAKCADSVNCTAIYLICILHYAAISAVFSQLIWLYNIC